jgi:hypothetical protein
MVITLLLIIGSQKYCLKKFKIKFIKLTIRTKIEITQEIRRISEKDKENTNYIMK